MWKDVDTIHTNLNDSHLNEHHYQIKWPEKFDNDSCRPQNEQYGKWPAVHGRRGLSRVIDILCFSKKGHVKADIMLAISVLATSNVIVLGLQLQVSHKCF